MKLGLFFLLFFSVNVLADDELKSTYLDFENAYMSNSVNQYAPWLSDDYAVVQTMHIPDLGSDSIDVSKQEMLSAMKSMKSPSSMPHSSKENTKIQVISESEFCGISTTVNQTNIGGKDYKEKEVRKVCFTKRSNKYLAKTHSIDVYYSEI